MRNYKISIISIVLLLLCKSVVASVSFNLELVSKVEDITEHNSNSNFGVSDVWGYTDETGIEYAIVGYRYGTFIYDVSTNPDSPVLIADILGPSNNDYYFHRDYKTYGDHLYIVNEMTGTDAGMQVIDLSPLPASAPIKRNTYTGVAQSHNLWIDNDSGYGFIEKNYPENVHIVDLANSGAPVHSASLSYWDAENCHDIYTVNNRAYISEGWSNQFGIYDISDILYPIQLATIPAFGYAHNAWLNNTGTHLVTAEETVGMTVKIWDIQDLDNINLVGEYLGENSLAHNVHVKGDFVYISHYTTGLKILDIYDPTDPIEVAAYDTYPDDDNDGFYGCWGAYPFTENNYVYASDMQYGLFVFSFDDVEAGWVYGTITDGGQAVAGVEIKSLLNGKIFTSNLNGEYEFGFPEGDHEFEFWNNGIHIETQTITIYPHKTTGHNIIFGGELVGDVNNDGVLNILDIIALVNLILNDQYDWIGDINSDELINILDVIQLVNLILS
jgi:choice-of-anchor B domain-containing protein